QRRCEQPESRAALMLPARADHAVGRAGSDDRRIRRQVGERLGQIVRRLAVLRRAEQRHEVGRALEERAAHVPRLLQRRRRLLDLRERPAGAHPARMNGLCAPLATITMRLLAISTRRVRPGWSVRLSLIVTHPWRTTAECNRSRGAEDPGVPRQTVMRPLPICTYTR